MTAGNNKSSATNNEDDLASGPMVKVVNIADPTVAEAMMQAERLDKNASNKNRNNTAPLPHSTPLVDSNALKQMFSFAAAGKKNTQEEDDDSENNKDNEVNEADAKQSDNRSVLLVLFVVLYILFLIIISLVMRTKIPNSSTAMESFSTSNILT